MKKIIVFILLLLLSMNLFAAEFLVYNKAHWMDSLTIAEIAEHVKKNSHFQAKYDARYQKGDIVEIRPDGYWTIDRKGFGKHAFALVAIPSMSMAEAKKYMEALEDKTDPENPILLKRRKYQMDMAQISLSAEKETTVSNIADAHITDKSKVVE